MTRQSNNQGQALLIIIMVLATVFAVVFSVSFTTTTDTKLTKLEEDSKKALAAAQSILEASLKKDANTYTLGDLNLSLSGFTGIATVSGVTGTEFVSPLLQEDEQYTFYLDTYNAADNTFASPNPYSLTFDLYLNSEEDCDGPNGGAAVELTFVDMNNAVTKNLIDPCDRITKPAADIGTMTGGTVKNTSFTHKTSTFNNVAKKLMFIRVLYAATKIGIVATSDLPSQGKTTTAQATTNTSVSSTVTLFQSYPQIPSDFFVTSF